jgi:hypothetical protein
MNISENSSLCNVKSSSSYSTDIQRNEEFKPRMFKKSPSSVGSSTALRSSDRRKLVNAVHEQYPILSADEAKRVVPEGIKSGKVMTSGEVPGVRQSPFL